jgi:2-oxoglutarate-Fe(II)-dependent oxygenase superfamily protein
MLIRLLGDRMYFDAERLLRYAQDHRQSYQRATPFPHLVIDNFFPENVLSEVLKDFPPACDATWKRFSDPSHVKLLSQGDSRLPPSIRHVLAQLRSTEFLSFLEILSGMEGLVADPHTGGCHQTERGGFLDVHVDASWNDRLALYTGINLFVYLNTNWSDDYGGHLELWDRDMRHCEQRILPTFNRMVIFSSGERTYHGHPAPLACPEGYSRKSLAANFCTSRRPDQQAQFRRSAVYRANGMKPTSSVSPKLLLSMFTPPIVSEVLRRARAKSRRLNA